MHTVNIIANLSLSLVLLACGGCTLYFIKNSYNLSKKTMMASMLAWLYAVLTVVMFTSLAIQAAARWDQSRYARECDK